MERLTKTYLDGTHGASDNLPCGENSYDYKNLLIEKLGKYEDLEEQGRLVKFYHCESLNEYYIGKRCGNFYYAKAGIQSNGDICLYYKWSRYLPWGEHIVDELSLWKGYTYPSEPKEISFEEWLKGWLREESVGRINRCRK